MQYKVYSVYAVLGIILLTQDDDELSVDPKRRKNYGHIYERERWKTHYGLPKPEPNAKYQCGALLLAMGASEADGGKQGQWGQARLVGAGKANGGRMPPASWRACQHQTDGKPLGQISSQHNS
jgi:hypothetical protein